MVKRKTNEAIKQIKLYNFLVIQYLCEVPKVGHQFTTSNMDDRR